VRETGRESHLRRHPHRRQKTCRTPEYTDLCWAKIGGNKKDNVDPLSGARYSAKQWKIGTRQRQGSVDKGVVICKGNTATLKGEKKVVVDEGALTRAIGGHCGQNLTGRKKNNFRNVRPLNRGGIRHMTEEA